MKLELRCAARASGRPAEFAAGVAERHGIARAGRGAERVLHAMTRGSVVTHVRQLFALRFSPYIALAIANAFQALRPSVSGVAGPSATAGAPRAPGMRTLRHEVLTTRLIERETRHSAFETRHQRQVLRSVAPRSDVPGPTTAAAAGPIRAAARVFAHRPSGALPAAAAVPSPAASPRTLAEGPLRHLASVVPGAKAIHAAIDVTRLTRDVMRGIDDRIVAHRERMGRG